MIKPRNILSAAKKHIWLIAACTPFAIALICTACNYASAAMVSAPNPEQSQTEIIGASDSCIEADPDENSESEDKNESAASSDGSCLPPEKLPKQDYTITDEMIKYFDDFVVVGDSICSGFVNCGYFKAENNLARPSIAAWNIHQFYITSDGYNSDVLLHIYDKQPKYILFSMGLNDVNLTTQKEFVDNYMKLLYDCRQASPNSELIVMAVTPVRSKFSQNEKIDSYNSALKYAINNSGCKHYHFVDPTDYLKNRANRLLEEYAFEDGTHLEQSGMKVCLWYLYNQGIEYSFTEDELKQPKYPDTSMYTHLY